MEAHRKWVRTTWILLALVALLTRTDSTATAAGYKTTNFVVSAPTAALAREIGETAERCRRELAIEWIGEEMPPWTKPCPIHARVAENLGAGGATSFVFDHGEVFDWRMNIQGNRERVLDSVLPHEVTHTIFASYFRRPLPRWADEGACTTVEHRSEAAKQERMLIEFLKTDRGIPFGQMFAMKDYPQDVLPLYAQGHSLAQMLIESRGKAAFLDFLADGMQDENWPRAVHAHYGFENLVAMQSTWLGWVRAGRPRATSELLPIGQLASNTRATNQPENPGTIRAQSPDTVPIPISDAESGSATFAATSTPAAGSVYASAAVRARSQQAAPEPPPYVYDASRPGTVMRR